MPMMPQMPAAYPGMTPLPPSRSNRRTGIIVGIVAGVVVLGILIMVGLAALGRASQGSEAEEFAKLLQAYKSKILPMEVEVIKLVMRLDDEDEALSLMSDIDVNLTFRIIALKTIDLNHHEIEGLNEDYIDYCEKGRQMWSDVIRQYEIGNYRKGD
jgi:hypothetical protein